MRTALILLGAALLLPGCTKTVVEYRDRVVTKEVLVPVRQPCPEAGAVPVPPRRIAEEHPVRPATAEERERILGAKVAELQGYVAEADAVMRSCAKP